MNKICTACSNQFHIREEDIAFYKKASPVISGMTYELPTPTLCPLCRKQRRLSWRNERTLYKRSCDFSKKNMLSMIAPDQPYKVYNIDVWWSDKWDPLEYGREFDFSRPFFEQFDELLQVVPQLNLKNDSHSTNSEFVNQTAHLKNCYLLFDADYCEDSFYGRIMKYSKDAVDNLQVLHSELMYENINCSKCFDLKYSQNADSCRESYFLKNCRRCFSCFGCINLVDKEYCFFNEQLSKEEYMKKVADLELSSFTKREEVRKKVEEWQKNFPAKENHNKNVTDSVGDYLENTKNAYMCFDCSDMENSAYCTNLSCGTKDCYDFDVWGNKAELIYECVTIGENANNCLFTTGSWSNITNLMYCDSCAHASDLFGCIGIKNKKYCILNKQYTKEEYEELVPRIIEHMRKNGEWGEFLPASISPFPYNDTVAGEFFPLSKEEIIAKNLKWADEKQKSVVEQTYTIPDNILDVEQDILNEILECEQCHSNYKIIPQELAFNIRNKIPVPRRCHTCRQKNRRDKHNPQKLWERTCTKCDKEIQTSYSEEKQKEIYCNECFMSEYY